MVMTTNSAGFSGAKADDDVDDAVVDVGLRRRLAVALHLERLARLVPWNAPCLNRPSMNALMLIVIAVHSGSAFGSNTTHFRLA